MKVHIDRDSKGKAGISLGDFLKIVTMILALVVFYFTAWGDIKALLVNHDVRIENNEKTIDKHDRKIDELQTTKVDKP